MPAHIGTELRWPANASQLQAHTTAQCQYWIVTYNHFGLHEQWMVQACKKEVSAFGIVTNASIMTVASAEAERRSWVNGQHTLLSATAQLKWQALWWLWPPFPIYLQRLQVNDTCTLDAVVACILWVVLS